MVICGIIFTAGGGWWGMQNLRAEVDKVETQRESDHDTLTIVKQQVISVGDSIEDIKKDQASMKQEQTSQRDLLMKILSQVQQAPPR